MTATIIFGPPGAGKTNTLLDLLGKELAAGLDPERIAFMSFTTAAVDEAVSRAMQQFKYTRKQFRWFRTLHSMAFQALGVDRDSMLTDYTHFAGGSGLRFSKTSGEELTYSVGDGDQFLMAHGLCAATGLPYNEVQRLYGAKIAPFRFERISAQLADYKKQLRLYEYPDLLTDYIAKCDPLPVDVAFVDEAQDLTPQQWATVAHALRNVRRLYIAGDDDQAIYQWAGADPLHMLNMPGERVVLDRSYRLGSTHIQLAQQLSARIKTRQEKHWRTANPSKACEIHQWWSWRDIDWSMDQSWLVLARANQFLPALAAELESRGLAYTWCGVPRIKQADARLYTTYHELLAGMQVNAAAVTRMLDHSSNIRPLALRSNAQVSINTPGLKQVNWLSLWPRKKLLHMERMWARYGRVLDVPPAVALTTIHRAKGTEADNVVLCPDMTPATWSHLGDAEHRVWYVAVTRSKRRLFVLRPSQEHSYKVL